MAPAIIRESAALAVDGKPPVILLRSNAVHLATTSDVSDVDVERALRLGVAIARTLAPR